VPLDGSAVAEKALAAAQDLARARDLPLLLIDRTSRSIIDVHPSEILSARLATRVCRGHLVWR